MRRAKGKRAETQRFYDNAHRQFFRNWEDNKLTRERCQALAQRASRYVIGLVLDLGCGFGFLSQFVKSQYLGIDFSPFVIGKAKILYGRQGVTFRVGNIRHLPELGVFDTVTMLEVLEHLDDPAQAIETAHRFATKRIVVSVPRHGVKASSHIWPIWGSDDVVNLLGEGSMCQRYRRWLIGVKVLEE